MKAAMHRMRVGNRWQMTIPREIRERFGIRPGQTLWMTDSHGTIRIFVEKPPGDSEAAVPRDA
jgi:AbrB family looped-hinge helix DNA binding protein